MSTLVYSKIQILLWHLNQVNRFYSPLNKRNFYCTFLIFLVLLVCTPLFAQNGPSGSYTEASLDDSLIRNAVGNVLRLLEGAFGALVMVVAGILAIISAAMGGYKNAISLLVVALGAFILRALISLFFGSDFEAFQN